MDRNSLIGLLLIGLIMMGYVYLNKGPEQAQQQKTTTIDSVSKKQAANQVKDLNDNTLKLASSSDWLGSNDSVAKKTEVFTIENDRITLNVNSKGGYPEQILLKEFKTWDKKDLKLFQESFFDLKMSGEQNFPGTSQLNFNIINKTKSSLELEALSKTGKSVVFAWSLEPNSYKVRFRANFKSEQGAKQTKGSYTLVFSHPLNTKEKNTQNERDNSTVYYQTREDSDVDKLDPIGADSLITETGLNWVAFKQQFFTTSIISKNEINKGSKLATYTDPSNQQSKSFYSKLNIKPEANQQNLELDFYFGPTKFTELKDAGFDLEKQIPLGWGIFGWVNKFLVIPVFNWLDNFGISYGIIILLLTIIIKLLLLPLQFRSYLSQAKMRVIKPEMDEINKKYEQADPMQKQQAVMELYKETGINPLGGCVPLLFQLPILLAMFNFFPNAIELRQQSFLWAEDLSTFDSIFTLPFSIPVYGDHVSLFALLMTISTIIYSSMNSSLTAGNDQMKALKWMMYVMPVIFLFVLNSYASGLNYYYFLANMITFGQQFAFTKLIDETKIKEKIQAHKLKPADKKVSKFQQKLEEMAKAKGINPGGKK
ncbi:MAG: membrane protein insertase YidC [Bacteroidia bacterium]